MNERIEAHGRKLNAIFPHATLKGGALARRVHSIEVAAHRDAERYANGEIDTAEYEQRCDAALEKLDKVLHFRRSGVPVFVNSDPRGCALKIEDSAARDLVIPRDWGGYGLLAPDLR
jgi:hypothetical protein